MSEYKHLSLEEREKLFCLKEKGVSLREIGRILGRSDTTLGRELKRNRAGTGIKSTEYLTFRYIPCRAQEKAVKRGFVQRKKAPLKETLIWMYVREHLREPFNWTPEQISGRLRLDHPGKSISTETIYHYIYSEQGRKYQLWKYLSLRRRKRRVKGGRKIYRSGGIKDGISIDLRPQVVEKRLRVGDWETDNVVGKQTDKTALSVTVDRLTRFSILSKVGKSSEEKTQALTTRLNFFPKKTLLTLTTDHGPENTQHERIRQQIGIQVFFCHSYHSWEKGTVENTNGRIRRYLPKGLSIDLLTDEKIQALEEKLNSTPRKCLGYLTPHEKMLEVLT